MTNRPDASRPLAENAKSIEAVAPLCAFSSSIADRSDVSPFTSAAIPSPGFASGKSPIVLTTMVKGEPASTRRRSRDSNLNRRILIWRFLFRRISILDIISILVSSLWLYPPINLLVVSLDEHLMIKPSTSALIGFLLSFNVKAAY